MVLDLVPIMAEIASISMIIFAYFAVALRRLERRIVVPGATPVAGPESAPTPPAPQQAVKEKRALWPSRSGPWIDLTQKKKEKPDDEEQKFYGVE